MSHELPTTVMSPVGSVVMDSRFFSTTPPSFYGHSDYGLYRQDVELWTTLTTLPVGKQGAALIGRIAGKAKAPAKTLPLSIITSMDDVSKILNHLDNWYLFGTTDQLDLDLSRS